jgi:hypothetical protein
LQTQLSEQGDFLVVTGQLPSPKNDGPLLMRTTMMTSSCCGGTNVHNKEQEGTCRSAAPQQEANKEPSTTTTTSTPLDPPADSQQQQQPPTSSKKALSSGASSCRKRFKIGIKCPTLPSCLLAMRIPGVANMSIPCFVCCRYPTHLKTTGPILPWSSLSPPLSHQVYNNN